MEGYQVIVYSCLAVIAGFYVMRWFNDPLRTITTVGGSSLPGLSYIGALRALGDCRDVLEEGYRKHPGSAFKIAFFHRWVVVVSGRSMVEELRKRGDEELSTAEAMQETLQSRYTLELPVVVDEYHVEVFKERLARRLPAVLPDIIDEVVVAVNDLITASENEWTSTELMPVVRRIVARASNRAFVGLPLCRNDKYLALVVDFTGGLLKSAVIIRLFPRFLKRLVALLVNKVYVKRDTDRAAEYLWPIIEERQRVMAEFGEGWDDKPNDLLQSLLDKAEDKNETIFVIAQRLLMINSGAIHTPSVTIVHALYHLAENSEVIAPLREEIEARILAHGWTAAALDSMWKLDSLLRETLRYYGASLLSMNRVAMKDIVFSDGTRIPKGTLVAAPSYTIHHDAALLPDGDADTFDPFRFARMREASTAGGRSTKHQFTSTSPEYIPFGHGPHACPGRYFAAYELKAILACIILNYDMKLNIGENGDGSRPREIYVATAVLPAPGGCILFRKREGCPAVV